MTEIKPLVDELKREMEWQRTPQEITDDELTDMIINGIKYLYMLTGRGSSYHDDMVS